MDSDKKNVTYKIANTQVDESKLIAECAIYVKGAWMAKTKVLQSGILNSNMTDKRNASYSQNAVDYATTL